MSARVAASARNPPWAWLRRRGPAVLTGIAVLAIAADAGRMALRAMRRPLPASAAVSAAPPLPDLAAAESLFGRPPVVLGAAPEVLVTDLELTGTIAVEDPSGGFGILRRRGEPEHFYRAGDALPGGGKLAEVYLDRVIVDSGAGRRTLLLPHAGLGGGLLATETPPQRQPRWVELAPEIPKARVERQSHPVNALNSKLASALHLNAYVVDNHILGYRIKPFGATPPIPGLPPKALIREINGVPLTDGEVAGRMIDSLPSAGVATFVIQTGDEQRSLTLDVSGLAALAASKGP